MSTVTTFVFAWTAAALLLPGAGWAGRATLCSELEDAPVDVVRVSGELEDGAVRLLDNAEIIALRGSHPFALHWTSHAAKLQDLKHAVESTARAWCRLPASPSGEQFGLRLAEVSALTERVTAMLQQNRLAHMGSEYQRTIQKIREQARQLNGQLIVVVGAARSAPQSSISTE